MYDPKRISFGQFEYEVRYPSCHTGYFLNVSNEGPSDEKSDTTLREAVTFSEVVGPIPKLLCRLPLFGLQIVPESHFV